MTAAVPNITAGSTKEFRLAARIDRGSGAAVWDLSAAAVTIFFVKPDGTVLSADAPVTNGPGGLAAWTNPGAFFGAADAGRWQKFWEVVDGPVVEYSEPEAFVLVDPRSRSWGV